MSKSRTKKTIAAAKKARQNKKGKVKPEEHKKEPAAGFFLPQGVKDVDIAFPGDITYLMPPLGEDSKPSQRAYRLASNWFYIGVKDLKCTMKPSIDGTKALRHISCILRSFQPKHEHKMEAAARLIDMWFEEYSW
jgi:hypothetical protein